MGNEGTTQDIRILSLYKQHYSDHHQALKDIHYSSLGYYDGIHITKIPPEDPKEDSKKNERTYASNLFKKKSNACLSRIWSGSVYEAANLNGSFGNQTIGIFRCSNDKISDFEEKSPYFATVFIQLYNRLLWEEVEKYLREISVCPSAFPAPSASYLYSAAYHTYDNADLVVLLYSNRLSKIQETLDRIQEHNCVSYTHSILGISESYLDACQSKGEILSTWNNYNCFINDTIAHIALKIATSGDPTLTGKLKRFFQQTADNYSLNSDEYKNILLSHSDGHGNLRIDINNTNVKGFLAMLVHKGLLTHENVLFDSSIYNIETSLFWNVQTISAFAETELPEPSAPTPSSIFAEKTNLYKDKMSKSWENEEEEFFCYYCALTQVCNTLAQYEGFFLSKDIYYLLIPAFQMFETKLINYFSQENISNDSKEQLRNSICEFANAVNSVVYHTIHTDQIFLMVPGYSGTTFSIPIKLCLMYSSIIKKVIDLLNDNDDAHYACLLTPELETRPVTTLINIGDPTSEDKLIRFSSSQRSLYMPRHFIILITHEIAHYVGKDIRNRHLRLQSMSKILAYLLAEGVFPEGYYQPHSNFEPTTVKERVYQLLEKNIKKKIQEKCVKLIFDKVDLSHEENKEHATKMELAFREICYELLEERGIIHQIIFKIPSNLQAEFSQEDISAATDILCDAQQQLNLNRRRLASSHKIINACIHELLQIFREIFSDVAALTIIKFTEFETFSEVFDVSEGNKQQDEEIQKKVREYIIRSLINGKAHDWTPPKTKASSNSSNSSDLEWPYCLKDNLFTYSWVGKYLENYAFTCADSIKKNLAKNSEIQKDVKELYMLFASTDFSCHDIYTRMLGTIESYTQEIADKFKDCR